MAGLPPGCRRDQGRGSGNAARRGREAVLLAPRTTHTRTALRQLFAHHLYDRPLPGPHLLGCYAVHSHEAAAHVVQEGKGDAATEALCV